MKKSKLQAQLHKVIAHNAQQQIEICKLRSENKQLRESYEYLDTEIGNWIEDYQKLKTKLEIAQADVARMTIKIATLERVIVLAGKR